MDTAIYIYMVQHMFVFLWRGTNCNFGMLVTLLLVGGFEVKFILLKQILVGSCLKCFYERD
jgi:hypothetical protein